MRETGQRRLMGYLRFWAMAISLYVVVRVFLVEAFVIPSGSMTPTLLAGDCVFVNKLAYGAAIPFTRLHLPQLSEPLRGDVIVFSPTATAEEAMSLSAGQSTIVKRLVGLPGDTLLMRAGGLSINGEPEVKMIGRLAPTPSEQPMPESADRFEWQRGLEVSHSRFGEPLANRDLDNWGPLVVPPDSYFVLGDNRHQSNDSRYWGIVPRETIQGRASLVYYSFKPGEENEGPLSLVLGVRLKRVGARIN